MTLESEKNWVHRPDSAFGKTTKQVMTAMGIVFFVVVIAGIFLMKKWLEGQ